jgi:hypothetical protein
MTCDYARIPTEDQNPAPQLAALQKVRCTRTFKHGSLSGITTQRPALIWCLRRFKLGDTLIVRYLDDIVVLIPMWWQRYRAVTTVHRMLAA